MVTGLSHTYISLTSGRIKIQLRRRRRRRRLLEVNISKLNILSLSLSPKKVQCVSYVDSSGATNTTTSSGQSGDGTLPTGLGCAVQWTTGISGDPKERPAKRFNLPERCALEASKSSHQYDDLPPLSLINIRIV